MSKAPIVQVPKAERDAYAEMMNTPDAPFVLALDPQEDSGGPYTVKEYRAEAVRVYAALRQHVGVGFSVKPVARPAVRRVQRLWRL